MAEAARHESEYSDKEFFVIKKVKREANAGHIHLVKPTLGKDSIST